MAKQIVEWVLRLALGGVFIYAGIVKVLDTQQFAIDVQNYQLTTWSVSTAIAVYLPWLEIVAGLAVIFRRLYDGALAAIFGMTLIFLVAIVSAWARGLDITCGCFGKTDAPVSYPALLIRDLALMGATVALGFLHLRRERNATQAGSPSSVEAQRSDAF